MHSPSNKKLPFLESLDLKIWPHLYLPDFIPLRHSWYLQIQAMSVFCFLKSLKPWINIAAPHINCSSRLLKFEYNFDTQLSWLIVCFR